MKSKKILIAVLMLLAAVSSCARPGRDLSSNILNMHGEGEPQSIDPAIASGTVDTDYIEQMFEGILRYDPKTLEAVPGIATRWEVSEDGKIYTFHIQKGVKWSDGTPLTAHDFVYSWKRVLTPSTGSGYAFIMYPIKNAQNYNTGKITDPALVGIKAVDNYTLQVTLENPTPYFLSTLPFFVFSAVPKHAIEKHGDRWTRPENIAVNGAFIPKEWVTGKTIFVEKNKNYWDVKNVPLDGIKFQITDDMETALKKYMAGELDILRKVPPLKVPSLINRPDFVKAPFLAVFWFNLNTTRPPLNDPRVREALAISIDRKKLTDNFLRDGEIPYGNIVPTGIGGYLSPSGAGFDPVRARKLMAEAGYADPKKFPRLTMLYNTNEIYKIVAEVFQSMWKENLGIDVAIENQEWKTFMDAKMNGNFDIARSGWIGDYVDPYTFMEIFLPDSELNYSRWKKPAFDNLLKIISQTSDGGKRMALLKKAEEMILAGMPVIPYLQSTKKYMIKPYVDGYYPTIQDIHPMRGVSLKRKGS